MQASEVQRLFDYLMESRIRFLEKFQELGWQEFSKDRGASWSSMLGIFLHIIEVEESWLHYALNGLSPNDAPSLEPLKYKNFDQMIKLNSDLSTKTRSLLSELKDEDLSKEVAFEELRGITRRMASTILTHAFVDEVAHFGELVCLLWQLDDQPPFLDWLDFQLS